MMTKLYGNAVTLLKDFKRDERGVTAIEYGLIGVAMAVALAAVFASDGSILSNLNTAFTNIASAISDVATTTPAGGTGGE